MESTMAAPRIRARKPVSALNKLVSAALLIMAVQLIAVQAVIIGMFIPPIAVFAALSLLFGALSARGSRWSPIMATLISTLLLVMFGEPVFAAVVAPGNSFPMFALAATLLPVAVIGIVAGIAATVQNYRFPAEARRTPRGLAYGLTALVALIAGALLVAAVPASGMVAEISPEVLDRLPALGTANFEFDQKELRVKAGESVTIKLTNTDAEAHFLDIDELDVHAAMPSGKTALAVFKPTEKGIYTFYCHPHANKETGEGMVGTLIVE